MTGAGSLMGLVGFARVLRRAGVACGAERVAAFLRAVEELGVASASSVYWAGRVALCAEPDDLPRYDLAFAAWFGGVGLRVPRGRGSRVSVVAALGDGTPGTGRADRLAVAASDVEVLRHKDIASLTPGERAHLRELLATLRPVAPVRRSARRRPARRGGVDPGRTLRAMLASGEVARPRYRRRAVRNRKVVLLVDVSGSMKPYADALLRFAHVVARRMPVEVFTIGTRLTRVTRQLRRRDPEQALAAAGRAVPDFAGGTRLGEALRAFLDRWGQRGAARRAVVVIFSDGWELGDPALLGAQAARLERLAHKVFWVNPHAGQDGYAPVQSGIAAVLPHVDRLLAGHSLDTLRALLAEVGRA
ncbi:VWA domain-containing protein [Actinosynnema sp. NPDC047251]|uniref:VWA containing CoxE family protein n=1 Tax=Saccharothrix espanaensis (strain ATCC 51144 / DSM 44229 / JCM 9112 / NBRC 15066 / NRRL 15764) TaxID=1179773 RepID=K0JQC3_SACES|nr:VWA domain-containing protein [Saccharothrix espanaensis]CCH27816.1 VWA containing CoxE family protein [Saccharothrix espanaensis DSM 44229]